MAEQSTRPDGVVVHHQPAATGTYVGSPGLAVLADGTLLASHDHFGPGCGRDETFVHRSTDGGATWAQIAHLVGQWWSSLFVHEDAVYLLGTTCEYGDCVIRRSDDGGCTWTTPDDERHGLLRRARHHTAPGPVLRHRGRLWRAMEDAQAPGNWGEMFRAFMMSVPVSRTAADEPGGGHAHTFHDANYLTFHRLSGYRDVVNAGGRPPGRLLLDRSGPARERDPRPVGGPGRRQVVGPRPDDLPKAASTRRRGSPMLEWTSPPGRAGGDPARKVIAMTYGGPLPEPDDPRDLPRRSEGQQVPGGRREPADPDDLPQPPRLLPRRGSQGQYRNGVGTFGMYLAGIALITEVLVGTPILLFLSLIAFGCGIVGWARVHRKQANNVKQVLVCLVVSVLAVGVGWFWSTKTSQCTYVDVHKQATCIQDNAGLL